MFLWIKVNVVCFSVKSYFVFWKKNILIKGYRVIRVKDFSIKKKYNNMYVLNDGLVIISF